MKKLVLFISLAVLSLSSPVWAGDALVNSEAVVDVIGKDATDAKAQAIAKGQHDALVSLLGKLTTPEQIQTIMTGLDADKIAAIVRGMEVLDERMTSNRYRARLIISFDGDSISQIVGKGAHGADVEGGEIQQVTGAFLVIPAYEEAGVSMLWEDDNPWRKAWKSVALETTAGDMVVPFGDNADMSVLGTDDVAGVTFSTMIPFTVRYGATDIIILQAKFTASPDMVVNVVKRRINRTKNEVNMITYRADPQETKMMLLTRAARDIAGSLQHKKTEEAETAKIITGGDRNKVMLLASVSTLSSWTQIRSKLSTLPMIDQIEMLAIAPNQVDVVLHYRGSAESLANGITAQNLRLVKNKDYWVVSRD